MQEIQKKPRRRKYDTGLIQAERSSNLAFLLHKKYALIHKADDKRTKIQSIKNSIFGKGTQVIIAFNRIRRG